MKRIVTFLLVAVMLCAMLLPMASYAAPVKLLSGSEVRQIFDSSENSVKDVYKSTKGASLPYRLYVPDDYDPAKKYPLVLFFHGAGERGTDNSAQISAGSVMQRLLRSEEQRKFPCLILAPQCPGDSQWVLSDWGPGVYNHNTMATPVSPYMAAAEELLDKVIGEYTVDTNRLYVTGMSMGGFGTWDIISRNPEKFAAAFPVCGGVDETYLSVLKGFPIYTFHNVGDTIVSSAGTKKAYEILKDSGGITYVEYNSTAHDAWSAAYATEDLMNWVFKQSASVMVNVPKTEGIEFTAPYRVIKGGTLKISFTAEEGYGVVGYEVNGKFVETSEATGEETAIAQFTGGEIRPVAGKLAKVSVQYDGGNAMVDAKQYVIGQSVTLNIAQKSGYVVDKVMIGNTALQANAEGEYVWVLADAETAVSVTYKELSANAPVNDNTDEDNAKDDVDNNGGSIVWIIIICALVVVLAGVAGAIFALKGKKK